MKFLVLLRMERALNVSGPREHQLLGRIDRREIVLRAVQMSLVRVAVPA